MTVAGAAVDRTTTEKLSDVGCMYDAYISG
jgi:hypothetical protein